MYSLLTKSIIISLLKNRDEKSLLSHFQMALFSQKTIFAFYNYNYIMNTTKKIQSALISVFSKEGLEPIVRQLNSQNVTLYSTGGTEDL
jgi:phosphoribosylaminoimidazolecarboxamide formyltransferase/IMP cyclohydrolase